MADKTPAVNPDIVNGLAVKHIPHLEDYIDKIFRSISKEFPEGLVYLRCERCTPVEEFYEETRKRSNGCNFNLAKSDFYMMKFLFSFEGEELPPRYIYFPYVSQGGTMTISGSLYAVTPVLADKVISIGIDGVFIRLLKARLNFERFPYNIMIDNKRETIQIVHSTFYNIPKTNKKPVKLVNMQCSLVHYLFCKYGFTETFRKYGNCTPVVGNAEINTNNYPEDEWVICKSTAIKPKGFGRFLYEPTDLRIAVKRSEFTDTVKSMVGGFFYIVDHFPSRILKEYVDKSRPWMVLLGYILFSKTNGEGKLHDDIAEHFRSLDEYIDIIVRKQLSEIGYECQDLYDLIGLVITNFNHWLIGSSEKVSSMYDKELSILYYIGEKIIMAIHRLHYKLRTASKKQLTKKAVITAMNKALKQKLIYAIRTKNPCTSTVSYSGDNKFFKITSMLSSQSSSKATQTGAKSRSNIADPSKRLHVSIAEVGGYSNLPGSEPTGRERINPHLKIDDRGRVLKDPNKLELLTEIQAQIQRN
jgi:hypothetical protein